MQQRVALARALAIEPSVLLLDEPLSALDAKVRVQLREEIRRIQLELGITTIYVTHDQEEALADLRPRRGHVRRKDRAGRVAGRDVRQPGDAVRRGVHRHDEPARLRRRGRRLRRVRRQPPARRTRPTACRAASACSCSCGPRRCELTPATNGTTPDGAVAGEVVSHIFLGSVTRVRIEDPSGDNGLTADISPVQAAGLTIGTHVTATFPPEGARLLSLADQPESYAPDPDSQ